VTLSLGAGRDELVLAEFALKDGLFGVVSVSDFQVGPFGDTVEFLRALSTYTVGWDGGTNPFSSGHLRLIDRDGAAVLQVDRDGSGAAHDFRDLILFSGLSASSLTRENLEGFDPRAPLQQATGASMSEGHQAVGIVSWDYQALA
jgi:hypothetical protein